MYSEASNNAHTELVVNCQSGTDFVFGFLESRMATGVPISKLYITSLARGSITVGVRLGVIGVTRIL